jgi:hypothetical protein
VGVPKGKMVGCCVIGAEETVGVEVGLLVTGAFELGNNVGERDEGANEGIFEHDWYFQDEHASAAESDEVLNGPVGPP